MSYIKKSKTDAVAEYIRHLISEKKLSSNGKIPSENSLSQKLSVSRVTVRHALAILANEGLIYTKHGCGSFAVNYSDSLFNGINIPFITSNDEVESRFLEIYSGAQNFLSGNNIHLTLYSTNSSVEKERDTVSKLFEDGFRNMLILPIALADNSEFYDNLTQKGAHFVFIDQKPPELSCNHVHSNNFSGSVMLTQHLIDLGHKKIAYIYQEMPEFSSSTAERLAGYKSALKRNGIKYRPELVGITNSRICNNTLEHLLTLPEPPTAILTSSDFLAMTVFELLTLKNISVPEDISLAGFDNLSFTKPNSLPLTTIDQDFYSMGYKAAEMLYSIIKDPSSILTDISIPVELILRNSVGKAKKH